MPSDTPIQDSQDTAKGDHALSSNRAPSPASTLELRCAQAGGDLLQQLTRVINEVPGADAGPQRLATLLGVDKVLASRLLKALRAPDPMSVLHRAPGPDPLRRVLKASAKKGVDPELIALASQAVDRFETLIRSEIGDRSALEAILSAWVPEARREFELRRKQSAFRAMSQLKGVQAEVYAETAVFAPAPSDPTRIDVVWIKCLVNLQVLRPNVRVKFTSRRAVESGADRRPLTLSGDAIEDAQGAILAAYSSDPAPQLEAHRAGELMHYLLEPEGFGASHAQTLVTCEVNRAEIGRYVEDTSRKAWASSDVNIPSRRLQFDVLVHEDLYAGAHPDLVIYDTAINGQADINDPERDIDRLDLIETTEHLGRGVDRFASSLVPRSRQLLGEVFSTLGFDAEKTRGYRVVSDYPIYGSQYAMCFPTQASP